MLVLSWRNVRPAETSKPRAQREFVRTVRESRSFTVTLEELGTSFSAADMEEKEKVGSESGRFHCRFLCRFLGQTRDWSSSIEAFACNAVTFWQR